MGKKVRGYKVDNRSAVTDGMESTYATMLRYRSWLAIDLEVTEHIDRVVIVLAASMVSYTMFLFLNAQRNYRSSFGIFVMLNAQISARGICISMMYLNLFWFNIMDL